MKVDLDRQDESRKRRRLNEGESDASTDISQEQDCSESDGSIEVVSVNRRVPEPDDEDDDDTDFILRALNESDGESDENGVGRSSRESTDINVVETIPSDEEVIEAIDLEAEILGQKNEDSGNERSVTPAPHKPVRDYQCPICFDPPENSVITPCGHTFCVSCLFQMLNSSRGPKKNGLCALCRKSVAIRDIKMIKLKKKRVRKNPSVT